MTRKLCVKCGGLVVMKNSQEPPLTMFGYVQCWACYDDVSERIEPPPERYIMGRSRCKTCGTRLGPERRCGRCGPCQIERRKEVRRGYMREYRGEQKSKALRAAG